MKKLARDIIAEGYKNTLILTVRGALEEEAVVELERSLNYAGIPYTLQEIEPGRGAELRSVISSILKTGIQAIIPLGDAGALGFIIQEIRNLGVEQPVYVYTTTEEGKTALKEQDIMPVYTMVLSLERPAEEDVIFMKNGDKLTGKVTSSSIGIQTPYAQIFFDARLIAGIIFGAGTYAEWAGKRLPTEAEWERAARGGLRAKKYPWGDSIDSSKANYGENVGQTIPVGRYPPNNYGLYDMGGNVWEWVSDWYDEDYYSSSDSYRNPQGPNYGSGRVIRGASWSHDATYLSCAGRSYVNPDSTSNHLGFRCAKSP